MKVWKQLVVVVAICGVSAIAWLELSPLAAPTPGTAVTGPGGAGGGMRGGGRGFGGGRGASASRVVTAEVTEAEAGSRLAAIGTAEAARSVTLFTQTAGFVSEVTFKAGDRVAAGDVLLRLDDAEQEIAVEQARVDVDTARAAVQRFERLANSPAFSAVQAQDARAGLARASNELRAAELALARRTLTAPFDGVMGFPQVEVGDLLSATTPIATIDDRDTVFVAFQVPERFAGLVAAGHEVSATTAAFGAERFTGGIESLDTRVDPASRSLKVRAALPNEDDRLRPGMAFSVTVAFDSPGRPAVPKIAVQWDRDGAYVWKVVDGRATRARVAVIARTADAVLVDGEIALRDIVVAEGLDGLREGAEIAETGGDEDAATRRAQATPVGM